MRKFRLKKKYPGSPELGETRTGSDENCRCYPTEKCMENNPEFWEEVVEKDYEILSLISNKGDLANYDEPTHLYPKPLNTYYTTREYWLECFFRVKQPGWKIHSVKRLSDGEVFTIGDLCNPIGKCSYNEQIIEKIELNKNGCLYFSSKNWHIGLSNIEHSKIPLFISEDGVVMYEGDPFWYVCKSLEFTGIFESTNYANAPNICYFSNEKDAEKYVLENKKSLSLKEVAKVIGECNNTTYVDLDLLTCKLKKIIESEES